MATTATDPPSLTLQGIERATRPDSGGGDGGDGGAEPLVLRVSRLVRVNDAKWTAAFTDGSGATLTGVLTTQAIQRLSAKCPGGAAGALADGDVVRVSSYSCISHANQMRLMAMSVEVLAKGGPAGGAGGGGGNGAAGAAAGGAAGAAARDAAGQGNANSVGGDAPASPADGGAGSKDQAAAAAAAAAAATANPATPARPSTAADGGGGGAAPAAAPATGARPPAPTPGEQPRLTPGTMAAAGLAGATPARGHVSAALSPGPPPPTALAPAAAAAASGGGGAIPVRAAGRPEPAGVVPIAALNPYESGCTIKAKVVRKNPMRSFSRGGGGGGGGGGGSSSVFSCELADAQGGAIQATFWRDAADRVHAALQEGRVYYFSRFAVKPSNKAYSAVRNDYELSFDPRGCEVEEAADQEASAEAVAAAQRACAVDAVPVARLPAHVGRKAPVDVLALVLQVGPVGSVKRKADNAELARRDLVVGDATGRSVVLTVWNALAGSGALEQAAAAAAAAQGAGGGGGGGRHRPMVLQVTSVRVGDYNGCSLSTVMRSELTAEPQSAEADALREWWDAAAAASGGAPPSFSPLGSASGANGGAGGADGGSRRGKITPLSEMLVPRGQEPAADAKPTYCTVLGHVASINADKDLYYLASAENGRKVTRQADGRLWCEGDGKFVEAAEHRYIFLARVEDDSGEAYLNVFNNDGARLLGGRTADELAALRDGAGGEGAGGGAGGGEDALRRVLKGAQWTPWVFTVQCKSREYNGERRMRYSVMSAAPVDFREQAARMLAALNE